MDSEVDADTNVRRLKKALALTKKLQLKVKFEREVSRELARRNDQLKRDSEADHEKYKTLLSAFDILYREYKDVLMSNKDLSNKAVLHEDWYEVKAEVLKTIRSTAGIERTLETNDILHALSGTSLLRTSIASDSTKSLSSPTPIAVHRRAMSRDSYDLNTHSSTRATSGSRLSSHRRDLAIHDIIDEEDVLQSIPSNVDIFEVDTYEEMTSVAADMRELSAGCDGVNVAVVPAVPLFEHFLVIGASVEAAQEVVEQRKVAQSDSDRFMSKMESLFRGSSSKPRQAVSRRNSWVGSSPTVEHTVGIDSGRRGSIFSRTTGSPASIDSTDSTPVGANDSSWRKLMHSAGVGGAKVNSSRFDKDTAHHGGMNIPPDHNSEHIEVVAPEILYQYPQECNPTLSQICDFCLPNGARLLPLHPESSESKIVDFLYGNYHDSRSSRCFVYLLEDKTLDLARLQPDEESGVDTGRTYCICVLHPRWLRLPHRGTTAHNASSTAGHPAKNAVPVEFETNVCYCFITRFPFFDFFFQVIWKIISYERIIRMESVMDLTNDRLAYEYLPSAIYTTVLSSLTVIPPPKFSETLTFNMAPSLSPVTYTRSAPSGEYPEHFVNAAEWALPPLLHWLSAKIIAWALGLIMCEIKLIIVGTDPATVSCAVIGLTSLLKPLQWSNPVIPSVPSNLIDFLQSVPPIIAGLIVECNTGDTACVYETLEFVGETETACAVLDLDNGDILMLKHHREAAIDFIFPGFQKLVTEIETIMNQQSNAVSAGAVHLRSRIFAVTPSDLPLVANVLSATSSTITTIADSGIAYMQKNNEQRQGVGILPKPPFPVVHEEEDENEHNESDNLDSLMDSTPPLTDHADTVNASLQSDDGDGDSHPADSLAASGHTDGAGSDDILSFRNISLEAYEESTRANGFLKRFVTTQMFLQYNSSKPVEAPDSAYYSE